MSNSRGVDPSRRDLWRWVLPGHSRYRALVPIVGLLAGLLFATTEVTSRGTDLAAGRRLALTDLITSRQQDIASLNQSIAKSRDEVNEITAAKAATDASVGAAQVAGNQLAGVTGLDAVTGSGLRVSLNDSKKSINDTFAAGVPTPVPDDLVVHQQDVQAVVNALWAGGASAMTIMGQRVISTSAVKCVGNTLLLHGQVYSPPFVVEALGNSAKLTDALNSAPDVDTYREYVDAYDLSYDVSSLSHVTLPGYDGTIDLEHAKALTP